MFVVVAYDIVDDYRRNTVARTLRVYGERVQRSVFECHLTEAQLVALQWRLSRIVEAPADSVRYYSLCRRDVRRALVDGAGCLTRDWDYYLV